MSCFASINIRDINALVVVFHGFCPSETNRMLCSHARLIVRRYAVNSVLTGYADNLTNLASLHVLGSNNDIIHFIIILVLWLGDRPMPLCSNSFSCLLMILFRWAESEQEQSSGFHAPIEDKDSKEFTGQRRNKATQGKSWM